MNRRKNRLYLPLLVIVLVVAFAGCQKEQIGRAHV